MEWLFDEKPIETISMQLCRPLEEMQALGVLKGDRLVSMWLMAEDKHHRTIVRG